MISAWFAWLWFHLVVVVHDEITWYDLYIKMLNHTMYDFSMLCMKSCTPPSWDDVLSPPPSHPPGIASPAHGRHPTLPAPPYSYSLTSTPHLGHGSHPHRHTTRHYVLTHTQHTHHHKNEMRALMEVASSITASPLIPCYSTNPVIATGCSDYRG